MYIYHMLVCIVGEDGGISGGAEEARGAAAGPETAERPPQKTTGPAETGTPQQTLTDVYMYMCSL